MRRRRLGRLGWGLGGTVLVMVASLLVGVGPAQAGTFLSVAPSFPVAATVGANVIATIQIANTSTPPETGGTLTLNSVTLVPSCGTVGSGDCPAGSADPGVFEVTQAMGSAGACAGTTFTITTVDAVQGKAQLAPSNPVFLGAPGGPADSCRIDLVVKVLKRPSKDAQPGTTGIQTV